MMVRAVVRDAAAAVPRRRALGVQALLEWAFGAECARLDFEEEAGAAAMRLGVDPIWRMMRQAELGCRVDGGPVWTERRADDAELVAAVVANLPVARGGRGMAVRVAQLARVGAVPDWMPGARPRVEPVEWRPHKHGPHAATEACGVASFEYRGRTVERELRWCPIVIRQPAAQIAAARRGYLDWWGALLHLQVELRGAGLARHVVTDAMPPMTPWRVEGIDRESQPLYK